MQGVSPGIPVAGIGFALKEPRKEMHRCTPHQVHTSRAFLACDTTEKTVKTHSGRHFLQGFQGCRIAMISGSSDAFHLKTAQKGIRVAPKQAVIWMGDFHRQASEKRGSAHQFQQCRIGILIRCGFTERCTPEDFLPEPFFKTLPRADSRFPELSGFGQGDTRIRQIPSPVFLTQLLDAKNWRSWRFYRRLAALR